MKENTKSVISTLVMLILLFIYSFSYFGRLAFDEKIVNILILLIITYYLSDRLFAVPRNTLANAISTLALSITWNYHIMSVYSLIIVFISLISLLFGEIIKLYAKNFATKFFNFILSLNNIMGASYIIISLLFIFVLEEYIDSGYSNIVIFSLILFGMIFITPSILQVIINVFFKKNENINKIEGRVSYCNSPFDIEAYLYPTTEIGVGDKVVFNTNCNDCNKECEVKYFGIITNIRTKEDEIKQLSNIRLFGILPSDDCSNKILNPFGLKDIKRPIRPNTLISVCKNELNWVPILSNSDDIIGRVYYNSTIEQIKIHIFPNKDIKRGDIVKVSYYEENGELLYVYYQVTNITNQNEPILNSTYGMNIAEASLLGKYSEFKFSKFKKTPYYAFPVWKVKGNIGKVLDKYMERIGYLPNTEQEVVLNVNNAVVYHTAILGTTGSGKSTLSKKINNLTSTNNIKSIILDVHGEYDLDKFDSYYMEFEELDVNEQLKNFIESEQYNELIEKIERGNDKTKNYLEGDKVKSFIDIDLIIDGLGKSNDDLATKTVLNYFKNEYYPKLIINNPIDSSITYDETLNNFLEGDKKNLILRLQNLNVDLQRWIAAEISNDVYNYYKNKGESELINTNYGKHPLARLVLFIEEAHLFVPESTGYDLGTNDFFRKKCINYLTNIALRGRKYGIGLLVISQRAAFVKKGILSQCNTIFALKTINDNDKRVFEDMMDRNYINMLQTLQVPEAIIIGKASSLDIPSLVELDIELYNEKKLEQNTISTEVAMSVSEY